MVTNSDVDEAIKDLKDNCFIEEPITVYLTYMREVQESLILSEDFNSVFQCMRIEIEAMKQILLIRHCNKIN